MFNITWRIKRSDLAVSGILPHPLRFLHLPHLQTPLPRSCSPSTEICPFWAILSLFKKRAHCASLPSCLCSFVPFSCPRCCTTGLLWSSLLPRGLVAFLGTGKLSLPPSLALSSFLTLCSVKKTWLFCQNYHYQLVGKYFTFWEETSRAHSLFLCCWWKPKQWSHGNCLQCGSDRSVL